MATSEMQARLKPEFRAAPPFEPHHLVRLIPMFPGVTERRMNLSGDRLTRIRGPRDFETVKAGCFEFRRRTQLEGVAIRA